MRASLAVIIHQEEENHAYLKKLAHGTPPNDRTKASESGRKGGKTTTMTVDKDPGKAKAGRKGGGQHSH